MTETRSLAADLKKKTAKELKQLAEEDYDLDVKGLKKAEVIEKIVDYLTEANDDDEIEDDEELDDEEDDELPDTDDELDDDEELPAEDDGQEYQDLVTAVDSAIDELDDEEDDLPEEPKPAPKKKAPPEPSGDTLSAKQVATRIGTDAKTLRKFFRSSASTVEAVGAGGRYEFAKEDLAQIQAEFEGWHTNKPARRSKKTDENGEKEPRRKVDDIPEEDLEFDEDELDDEELELDDELDDEEED